MLSEDFNLTEYDGSHQVAARNVGNTYSFNMAVPCSQILGFYNIGNGEFLGRKIKETKVNDRGREGGKMAHAIFSSSFDFAPMFDWFNPPNFSSKLLEAVPL